MSSIRFNQGQIEEINRTLSQKEARLVNLRNGFSSAANGVDFAIRARRNIQTRLQRSNQTLQDLEAKMKKLDYFVAGAVERYDRTEVQLTKQAAAINEVKKKQAEVTAQGMAKVGTEKTTTKLAEKKTTDPVKQIVSEADKKKAERLEKLKKLYPKVYKVYNPHAKDLVGKITKIDQKKFSKALEDFKKIYEKNKKTYEKISKETGFPPELIAALHYRESTGNFNKYLQNGDPLGKPTTHVPKGLLYYTFEESAVAALTESKFVNYRDLFEIDANCKDIAAMTAFAECYNGLGYYNKNKVSPYAYSGTNVYTKGKYTDDGVYSPNVVDGQPGVYILLMALMQG
ncbi:hypothetical protein [Cohnella mopanensis]|uniref:hypothetical protein n=1 Tax=Cohnella mopanensis TaxID=2911966 RepID=UPI001EF97D77|nr:hypothetical protein [Cohnella mopanensis]